MFGRRLVLVVAAPAEALAARRPFLPESSDVPAAWTRGRLTDRIDLLVTGVGKVNAAGACARLLDPGTDGGVINLGLAGALPGGPPLLAAVTASRSTFADEGLLSPEGFIDCAAMGFPLGDFSGSSPRADPALVAACLACTDASGPVATVSTCSGTDAAAAQVVARTGAVAEAMEGAAVLQVAQRLGIPAAEVRVISNTTGDRPRQRWDLPGSLACLSRVIGRLAGRPEGP
jgi:futalosine hydrolase